MIEKQKGDQRSKANACLTIGMTYLLFMLTGGGNSFAQDVTLGLSAGSGIHCQAVRLSLNLSYAASPLASGFNLDIYYNKNVLMNPMPTAGSILTAAGKTMSTSYPNHPYFGVVRIIVAGFNQTVIPAGQVATIDFVPVETAPNGLTVLDVTNVQATNSGGQALTVLGNDGSIEVLTGTADTDSDGVSNCTDNCPNHINPLQEDTYPPQTNGVGNACECEGNFDGDSDQDSMDTATFKRDLGRSSMKNPCTTAKPCNGDFTCDGDVDSSDAALFKTDLGRSSMKNPCPICLTHPWCSYP